MIYKASLPPIVPVDRAVRYHPLSYAQERLWFLERLTPGTSLYHIVSAFGLEGALDKQAIVRSLQEVVRRHASLRTVFGERDGTAYQVVRDAVHFAVQEFDLKQMPTHERDQRARDLAGTLFAEPFDLINGPVFRVALVKMTDAEHVLIFVVHHIASDGWSHGVLLRELTALYQAFHADEPSPLPELDIQYVDFAHWERASLTVDALKGKLQYWREGLRGAPTSLDLPFDRARPTIQSHRGALASVVLPADVVTRLADLAKAERVTQFMAALAAFQVLLARHTNQEDFLVGTPIANRRRAQENLIGLFVNTLVLRADLTGEPSCRGLLRRVRELTLAAYVHQDLPFQTLVNDLCPARDMSRHPIFQVMFTLIDATNDEVKLPRLTIRSFPLSRSLRSMSMFDLSMELIQAATGEIVANVEYSADLFEDETIHRMLAHFERLIRAIVNDPDASVFLLPILEPAERRRVVVDGNATDLKLEDESLVHNQIAAWSHRSPRGSALEFESARYTYERLGSLVNQLARVLLACGAGTGIPIAVCLPASIDAVGALLAVLTSGSVYVPIDADSKPETVRYILENSKAALIISDTGLFRRFGIDAGSIRTLALDRAGASIARQDAGPLGSDVQATDLAYVIYPSQTAARPKGVMIEHASLRNHVLAATREFGITLQDRVMALMSRASEWSLAEILVPLANGAASIVRPHPAVASATRLVTALREDKVSIAALPPSAVKGIVEDSDNLPLGFPSSLRLIVARGEDLPVEVAKAVYWRAPSVRLLSTYGSLESTNLACVAEGDSGFLNDRMPIGKPIANTRVYVLDRYMSPLGIGMPGEIYIAGASVARGYLGDQALTDERFTRDPFVPGSHLYRTGHIGRYLPDGQVMLVGQRDR